MAAKFKDIEKVQKLFYERTVLQKNVDRLLTKAGTPLGSYGYLLLTDRVILDSSDLDQIRTPHIFLDLDMASDLIEAFNRRIQKIETEIQKLGFDLD